MSREPPALHVVAPIQGTPVLVMAMELDPLFRRYAPYVAAIAYRILGRDDEVDDTVQEVFLAAVRGLGSVRDPGAVKAWLARLAVRSARHRLRARRLWRFLGLDDGAGVELIVDGRATPEQHALLERVYRVLDSVSANERIAWTLRYVEGEPLDRVAALSECSLATAKRRIAAAAKTIEEAFLDE